MMFISSRRKLVRAAFSQNAPKTPLPLMKNLLCTFAAVLAVHSSAVFAVEPNTLTAEETAAGWKLLFDGRSLAGWHSRLDFRHAPEDEASRQELLDEPLTTKTVELYVSNDHMGSFFDCIRSRKVPICEAEIAHRSVSVCHLGVVAARLGRKLKCNPELEQFVDDKEADSYIAREQRKPFTYDSI